MVVHLDNSTGTFAHCQDVVTVAVGEGRLINLLYKASQYFAPRLEYFGRIPPSVLFL